LPKTVLLLGVLCLLIGISELTDGDKKYTLTLQFGWRPKPR
jgi:hypothetical protein